VLEVLLGSGPLAAVLGFAVWQLWRDNRSLREELRQARDEHRRDLLTVMTLGESQEEDA